ncbi:MAG: dihydroorotase [Prochlorococcaceae cyanobacterium]
MPSEPLPIGPLRLLQQVQLLSSAGQPARAATALLEGPRLRALDGEAIELAARWGVACEPAEQLLLAPALIDPHSVLEDPLEGRSDTLASLERASAAAGYGSVALLPRCRRWRDAAEALQLRWDRPQELLLWGSFSLGGQGEALADHAGQIAAGAIGVASAAAAPLGLLERGLRLAEMGRRPVLVAPLDPELRQDGFVREAVEALRAGWPIDPAVSETVPLQALLALAEALPDAPLRLMNLSTAAAVAQLRRAVRPLPASVGWWHLLADSGNLDPLAEGWRLEPSLGSPADREALIAALAEGLIEAVAVNHVPLDPEEQLLPLDQRRPGLAGYDLVLPLLWQELVLRRGWRPEALWQALCWGPARFLGLPEPRLECGSCRWLLFDPVASWRPAAPGANPAGSLAANQPRRGEQISGRVLATGMELALRGRSAGPGVGP